MYQQYKCWCDHHHPLQSLLVRENTIPGTEEAKVRLVVAQIVEVVRSPSVASVPIVFVGLGDGGGPDPSHGRRSDSGVVFGRPIIVLSPSADVPGNKQDKIVATHDIDAESGVGFFDSYLDTPTGGFVDFVVDYPD